MLPDALSASALGRSVSLARTLRERVEAATAQVSTGRAATLHGELGASARRSIDLRAEIGRLETHAQTAARTLGRAGAMQSALGRLHEIAGQFAAEALRLVTLLAQAATSAAAAARAALEEVAGLLNLWQDGEYLFAGADTARPPVVLQGPVADSPMAQQIAIAVGGLALGNAPAVIAATEAAVLDPSPAANPFARFVLAPRAPNPDFARATIAADGAAVAWGAFTEEDAAARGIGELVRGLAIIAALTPAVVAQDDAYAELLGSARAAFADAGGAIALEQARLGAAERRLAAARDSAADSVVLLRAQVSAIEDVDVAETVARLQELRARLEASYRATALLSELSLARFLR
ncbi:MAG: flagellin [Acetobacteraceae bacterium]|nr:flagellin [Acetobacteraceae bacterium]